MSDTDNLAERIAILEAELADAAKILQTVLPIGQLKHIGLLEVAAGVQRLAEDNAALEAVLRECREECITWNRLLFDGTESKRETQALLSRIDALTAKGAGQ